ncbi:YkuS family protein [Thermosediminibacter oceani]|uniref:YkuS family protein n=1 Tax=Thermosediminibacter oceani (strain ATCC BAA-1034 / DSM 16646 / JW/IW-1228P) TaxID=555079 RepID=D9S194_THEOJ|nr:YkuS family protein [Thermosediminibacter oceani]ADL08973.1 protein of unknown function UPF0180 [Thermosediminibacter oceani DSM 16646]
MKKTIAVDDSLSNVKELLKERGYAVTRIGDNRADAIVVNGLDDNFSGIEDTTFNIPVVNAEGKTVLQVLEELEGKL